MDNMLRDIVRHRTQHLLSYHWMHNYENNTIFQLTTKLALSEIKYAFYVLSFHEDEIIHEFNVYYKDRNSISILTLLHRLIINEKLSYRPIFYLSGLIYLYFLQTVKTEDELKV